MGTAISFLCTVTVDTELVDTPIRADFEVSLLSMDERASFFNSFVNSSTIQWEARLSYLLPQDADNHTCVSSIQPNMSTPYVRPSIDSSASYTLEVEGETCT